MRYSNSYINYFNKNNLYRNIKFNNELLLSKQERELIFNSLNLEHDLNEVIKIKIQKDKAIFKIEKIFEKIKKNINEFLSYKNLFYNRKKMTMYWFLRESLKFGTHSRESMNYNLSILQNITDSILIGLVINKKYELNYLDKLIHFKKYIEEIYEYNKLFYSKKNNYNEYKFDLSEYYNKINDYKIDI